MAVERAPLRSNCPPSFRHLLVANDRATVSSTCKKDKRTNHMMNPLKRIHGGEKLGHHSLGMLLLAIACSVLTTLLLLRIAINDNDPVTPRVMVQKNIWVSESNCVDRRPNDRSGIGAWSLRKRVRDGRIAAKQSRQGSPNETNHNGIRTSPIPKRQFVICTRVRNEAPYLKEWIEYHRMIGFEAFLLLNDDSTDDTQCLLDEYASSGIVHRIPQEVDPTGYNLTEEVDNVFDVCATYLKSHPEHFNTSTTWMSTHDTDEFLWFKKTESVPTFGDAVSKLIRRNGAYVESLAIPRLVVGSSGNEYYTSGLVMDRFTRRFNIDNCPNRKQRSMKRQSEHRMWSKDIRRRDARRHQEINHRRLFEQNDPVSYCLDPKRENSFDYFKSMSLVENMAKRCFSSEGTSVPCSNTHRHTLTIPKTKYHKENYLQTVSTIKSRAHDCRYLNEMQVGTNIVIMHYMTKSRQEFYERVCSSEWLDKYSACPSCSPETYFNLTMTYADNFEDQRMAPFSAELKPILQASTIGKACNTSHPRRSLDYFKVCIEHGISMMK